MTDASDMPKALDGLVVLDLSRILAGPTATQLLGNLGATIIKVENPSGGDDTRHWGPPFMTDDDGQPTEESAYYLSANRGKRSVMLDFSDPDDLATLTGLAREADILVENFKVGGLRKFGLDYETLSKANPGLVYCSITGFGQTGPYAGRAGYDYLTQGMSGLMSITGAPDGEPQRVGSGCVVEGEARGAEHDADDQVGQQDIEPAQIEYAVLEERHNQRGFER